MVKTGLRVGAFVFRLLGLVGNLLVGWRSGSVPADKGVGALVALHKGHSSRGDRSCPSRERSCRGENGVAGFAEGLQQPQR